MRWRRALHNLGARSAITEGAARKSPERDTATDRDDHSHSIVAGGFPEISYTTRLIPRTSLMIRFETRERSACGSSAHCAVMKSTVCTARSATTYSYVRPS